MLFKSDTSLGERIQLILSFILKAAFIVAGVIALFEFQWMVAFVSFAALVASFFPAYLSRNIEVRLPTEFEFVITVFVFAALFLGEVQSFYARFWWWDLLLHGVSGIVLGFVGFLILYTLYADGRLKASPFMISVFAFTFSVAIGALWEIFEFTADALFGLNMQKSGLLDTMGDLIVDTIGAALVAISGYFYIHKVTWDFGIFDHFIKHFLAANPHIVRKLKR